MLPLAGSCPGAFGPSTPLRYASEQTYLLDVRLSLGSFPKMTSSPLFAVKSSDADCVTSNHSQLPATLHIVGCCLAEGPTT